MAMTLPRARVGTTLEVAALGPAIFAAFGPSFFTVRTFAGDAEGVRDIRVAEVMGTVMTLTLGVGAGWAVEDVPGIDPYPILAAVGVSVVMVGMYEYALRHPHANSRDMAAPAAPGITVTGSTSWDLKAA